MSIDGDLMQDILTGEWESAPPLSNVVSLADHRAKKAQETAPPAPRKTRRGAPVACMIRMPGSPAIIFEGDKLAGVAPGHLVIPTPAEMEAMLAARAAAAKTQTEDQA